MNRRYAITISLTEADAQAVQAQAEKTGLTPGEAAGQLAKQYCIAALTTDGAHHKQWYLERILLTLGGNPDAVDHEKGIAP